MFAVKVELMYLTVQLVVKTVFHQLWISSLVTICSSSQVGYGFYKSPQISQRPGWCINCILIKTKTNKQKTVTQVCLMILLWRQCPKKGNPTNNLSDSSSLAVYTHKVTSLKRSPVWAICSHMSTNNSILHRHTSYLRLILTCGESYFIANL